MSIVELSFLFWLALTFFFNSTAFWTLQEYLRSWILCVPLCTELDAMVRKLMISLICFNIFQSKWYRNALIGVPNDKSKLREDCLYLLLQRGVHYITLFIYLCFMSDAKWITKLLEPDTRGWVLQHKYKHNTKNKKRSSVTRMKKGKLSLVRELLKKSYFNQISWKKFFSNYFQNLIRVSNAAIIRQTPH